MKTKQTEGPAMDLPLEAHGTIIYDRNRQKLIATTNHDGTRDENVTRAAFIVRACNAHADLVAALEGLPEGGPAALRALATWFDMYDDERGSSNREVQAELRVLADKLAAALAALEKAGRGVEGGVRA